MTKKDYEKAAKIVKQTLMTRDPSYAQVLSDVLIELFAGDNPRFDRGRFLKACGL